MSSSEDMTVFKHLRYKEDADTGIAVATMNYPERLNPMAAYDSDIMEALSASVEHVNRSDSVKVLIIRGAGRAFCVGGDIEYVGHYYEGWQTPAPGQRAAVPPISERLSEDVVSRRVMEDLGRCMKVTIAEVHGYCLGGGFDIAAACDLVISSDDAVYGHPYWRFVGPGGDQNTAAYIMLMGFRRATELMFTGRWITAQEALEFGFVNHVVPGNELADSSLKLASSCALLPMDGIVMGKAALQVLRQTTGIDLGYHLSGVMHSLGVGIQYRPGEFNLMKSRRDLGPKGAIREVRERFAALMPEPPRPVWVRPEDGAE